MPSYWLGTIWSLPLAPACFAYCRLALGWWWVETASTARCPVFVPERALHTLDLLRSRTGEAGIILQLRKQRVREMKGRARVHAAHQGHSAPS